MGLETSTYVNGLNTSNPAATDGLAQADDHIRLIKTVLKNTFPNLNGAVTASPADLNNTSAIPTTLTDLGISDGSNGQVLQTNGSGNFSFITLPTGSTDTNYYVTGGSYSSGTLTLTRNGGLSNVSISGLPAAITDNSQLINGAGYITATEVPTQSTSLGALGTYALLGKTSTGTITKGTSYAGSGLVYAGTVSTSIYNDDTAADIQGTSPSGTWRAMGEADRSSSRYSMTLFVKIAN